MIKAIIGVCVFVLFSLIAATLIASQRSQERTECLRASVNDGRFCDEPVQWERALRMVIL